MRYYLTFFVYIEYFLKLNSIYLLVIWRFYILIHLPRVLIIQKYLKKSGSNN